MKWWIPVIVYVSFLQTTNAQPFLPPNFGLIQENSISDVFVNDSLRNVTVGSFYVAQYLESNYQYKKYLDFLKQEGNEFYYNQAQPSPEIWNSIQADDKSKAYLMKHYALGKEFSGYPILGLDDCQIQSYLRWKSEEINKAYLVYSGCLSQKEVDSNGFDVIHFIRNDKAEKCPGNKVYPSFRSPTLFETTSAVKTILNGKQNTNRNSKDFFEWLKKNLRYEHLHYIPRINGVPKAIRKILKNHGIEPIKKTKIRKTKTRVLPEYVVRVSSIEEKKISPERLFCNSYYQDISLQKTAHSARLKNGKSFRILRENSSFLVGKGKLKAINTSDSNDTNFYGIRLYMSHIEKRAKYLIRESK